MEMIRHHKIIALESIGPRGQKQLDPIRKFITKGVADAKDSLTLTTKACDAQGAKQFNPQHCVIAKCADRTLHPKAISVCRSAAYLVFNGVAIRYVVAGNTVGFIDRFDQDGVTIHRPVVLSAPSKTARIGAPHPAGGTDATKPDRKRKKNKPARVVKMGVRALNGGKVIHQAV